MKRLIVARHAKSSWDQPNLSDHDRPLNKRGKRVAPAMGEFLARQGSAPELIVSSTAERALRTADAFARAFENAGQDVMCERTRDLYHASAGELLELVWALNPAHETVLLVGHNPGMEEFLGDVCRRNAPPRFPTCAVAVVEFNVELWTEVHERTGTPREVWLPRELEL